jgi:HK97 family phage prohead protease
LWNHDSGEILGSTRAKTLTLTEDANGLRVDGVLPLTSRGKDAAFLLKRGDIDSMSFGFSVPTGGDAWSSDGSERTLNSVRLFEVSLVGSPAYTATAGTVSVRKFEKAAERAAVSVDALADALGKIEDGLNITGEEQELLNQVITTLAPEVENEVIPEAAVIGNLGLLELKKKKLELLMKGI